ncbi:MAG: HAD hydrolase-like protein [Proteobacteria bacterium]|jgi:phosphoglycolate phosphatase|nr:HAD hydrolase-like protein [Pseudomonadota bacterium]
MGRLVRHIFWDWNGTIVDDAWLCVEVMNSLLEERNLPLLTLERYRRLFRFPVIDYYFDLGFDPVSDSFESLGPEFIRRYKAQQHRVKVRDGALEALDFFLSRGLPQSVLSASHRDQLHRQAEMLGIKDIFVDFVGRNDYLAEGKTALGRAWLKTKPLSPHEVILIGDTDHDASTAAALGLQCILLVDGHQLEGTLSKTGAEVEQSPSDLVRRKWVLV